MTNKPLDHFDLVQQGSLSEGDVSPCTNYFRSAALILKILENFFYRTSYLNEEVISTEPSPSLIAPCYDIFWFGCFIFED